MVQIRPTRQRTYCLVEYYPTAEAVKKIEWFGTLLRFGKLQVGKGGLPPLVFVTLNRQRGKPPFPTCNFRN